MASLRLNSVRKSRMPWPPLTAASIQFKKKCLYVLALHGVSNSLVTRLYYRCHIAEKVNAEKITFHKKFKKGGRGVQGPLKY
jgi:hypothetical protein